MPTRAWAWHPAESTGQECPAKTDKNVCPTRQAQRIFATVSYVVGRHPERMKIVALGIGDAVREAIFRIEGEHAHASVGMAPGRIDRTGMSGKDRQECLSH
jgi:hypothetical protein